MSKRSVSAMYLKDAANDTNVSNLFCSFYRCYLSLPREASAVIDIRSREKNKIGTPDRRLLFNRSPLFNY